MAKEFFAANGILYEEKNVATDAVAREEMLNKTQQMGVPVIQVDNDLMVGFNQAKLKELLELG